MRRLAALYKFLKSTNEGGFTLVEILFSGIVLIGSIIAMMSLFQVATSTLVFTNVRSLATGLANEQIEYVRSLDYEQVYNYNSGSWPDDPNLNTSSNPPQYKDKDESGNTYWRPLILSNSGGVSLEKSIRRRNVDFIVRTYILWVQEGSQTQAFKRIVVKIKWLSPGIKSETVVTSNYSKEDVNEPRPTARIVGIDGSNFNIYKGISEMMVLGMEDYLRQTVTVRATAKVNSARASGITDVVFKLYSPAGDVLKTQTVTTPDANGYYKFTIDTTAYLNNLGYLIEAKTTDDLGGTDLTTMRVNIDNRAPAVPDNFEATPVLGTGRRVKVEWRWTAAADDNIPIVSRFILYRKERVAGSTYSQIAAPPGISSGSTAVFYDTGLDPSKGYTYKIMAVDMAGNTASSGDKDQALTRTQNDFSDPTAPANLTGEAASWKSASLWWEPSSDIGSGVSGYNIRGSDDGTNFTVVGQVGYTGINPEFYQDSGLKGGKTYTYRVRAWDSEGNLSAASNDIQVATPYR